MTRSARKLLPPLFGVNLIALVLFAIVLIGAQPAHALGETNETAADRFNDVIANEDIEDVRRAITEGADVNQAGTRGLLPLVAAVESGNAETVELLLDAGADPDIGMYEPYAGYGQTPIHFAIQNRDMTLLTLLLERGADLNATYLDDGGSTHTALSDAVMAEDTELVRYLIDSGADGVATHCFDIDCSLETYLDTAVLYGNVELVRLFAAHGNAVDHPATDLRPSDGFIGRTPLMLAAEYGRTNVVSVLLDEYGVNVSTRNGHGCTAIDFAIIGDHDETAELLRNAGADPDRIGCRLYRD